MPFDLVPWLRGPAPYPPEWQWAFRPEGPARPLTAAAACVVALLALLAASGTAWMRRRTRIAAPVLVVAAVLLGWGLQLALLAREPGSPLATLLSRTRSRSFTSHHAVAISPEARDPRDFLRGHAERLPTLVRSAKHAATHPPGPVLFYRAALAVCEASPALTEGLLDAAGTPDRAFPPPATRPARAAALLGALALGLLGAAAAVPVFSLARALGLETPPACRLALLWALLPGPALMTPQFDQALALPVAAATVLLLRAASADGWAAGVRQAALAGVLGGLAVFTSYGAAAFLAVGGVAALLAGRRGAPGLRRSPALAVLAAAMAALVAFGVPALHGHEPLRAMVTALSIHREVYTAPRSYALWLLFNPLDLCLFLGVPVAVTGSLRGWSSARRGVLAPPDSFRRALLLGVAVLLLLGVTRGEVGRLWIPLMPLLLVTSLGDRGHEPDRGEALTKGALLGALVLAMGSYWVV